MRTLFYKKNIIVTLASLLVCNADTHDCEEITVSIPRRFKNNKDLFAYCRKFIETDTVSVVKVLHHATAKRLYRITPEKFVENAELINEEII